MNHFETTDTLSTLTNSISKLELDELFHFTEAIMDDADRSSQQDRSSHQNRTSRQDRATQPSISDEVIKKGDLIQNTYKVTSNAISGGMGSVWRVHHMSWGTDLAMKRPQPRYFAEAGKTRKENFIEECVNWIHLGLYPNIVTCYYVRDISGVPSIFSEWMDGGSLRDRIRDGSLYKGTPEEIQERILDIAIQAARGLYYAHVNNMVHQDVKPGNILLSSEWDAKIADFGLAKARANLTLDASRNETGSDQGNPNQNNRPTGYTIEYCPLAQSEGAEAEPWMDTYALALTILEMYIGKRPWSVGAEGFDWFRKEYAGYCKSHSVRAEIPEALVPVLSAPANFQNHWDSMKRLADTLVKTYQAVTGNSYPRKDPTALENRAGTLNNMALSFLDLGREDTARRLLNEAFESDPHHPDVIYNRGLMRWRNGEITDEEAINAVREIRSLDDRDYIALLEAQLELERGRRSNALAILDKMSAAEDAPLSGALALAEIAAGQPEDVWEEMPYPFDGSFPAESVLMNTANDAFWIAGEKKSALEAGFDGRILRKLRGVHKIDCLSEDEKLIAAIEETGVRANAPYPEQREHCCNIYDAATGKKLLTFDTGLSTYISQPFFLDGDKLLAIAGVAWIETGYNEHDDTYDTKDVSDEYIRVYHLAGVGAQQHSGETGTSAAVGAHPLSDKSDAPAAAPGSKAYALLKDDRLDLITGRGAYIVESLADGDPAFMFNSARTLALLDARTGREIRRIDKLDTPVTKMLFSKDCERLYVLARDGFLRAYSIPDGKLLHKKKVTAPDANTKRLWIAPNGTILTGERGYSARYWNAEGRCMLTLRLDGQSWLDADGSHIICGPYMSERNYFTRFRLPAGDYRAPYSLTRVRSVKEQLSDEERFDLLMKEARDSRAKRDLAKAYDLCCQAREIPGFGNAEMAVRFLKELSVYGRRTTLRGLHQTGLRLSGTDYQEDYLGYTWDGKYLLYILGRALFILNAGGDTRDGSALGMDSTAGAAYDMNSATGSAHSESVLKEKCIFKSNGESVMCAVSIPLTNTVFVNTDQGAYLLDITQGKVIRRMDASLKGMSSGLRGEAAVSKNGRYLAISTRAMTGGFLRKKTQVNRILVWDLQTDRKLLHWDHNENEGELCFGPDGKKLYMTTQSKLFEIPLQDAQGSAAAWSKRGVPSELVKTCEYSKYLRQRNDYSTPRLDISSDGKVALIQTRDFIVLFNVEAGREIVSRLKLAPGIVDAGLIARTRKMLCTYSDATIRLLEYDDRPAAQPDLNQASLTEVFSMSEPLMNRYGSRVAVSPDGDKVAVTLQKNGVEQFGLEWNYEF